ncbi:hypothetical protein [Levilactobacillus tujiorum]|uniref:Uncharacterized protein n=1 Tax=Levilactobacillus tujiorum TaxID=2912243 RepID=A0ABX1L8L8_9LACO|nr:hypothetical protein [Levilactobacillus tujiorum]MCH5465313.1 hypothetical protein [Levilactobacillus tujiorum]NLR12305.1 hypothetical protein [Lactobacillus sp. HBUAS51387]NLR30317.1 hypothetical protein [Levilactobacillus tujiorum]
MKKKIKIWYGVWGILAFAAIVFVGDFSNHNLLKIFIGALVVVSGILIGANDRS